MNEQLLLSSIRGVLIRLEETIIFALVERAQFAVNAVVYRPDAVGHVTGGESIAGFILRETEKTHAKMRRYTSPDETPFYLDLPEPILPPLTFLENPLHPNVVNLNRTVRQAYEQEIVPFICRPGDDGQYGSSAVSDVNCLQALSKRIHYGKFVAESKYQTEREQIEPLMRAGDAAGILAAITHAEIEARVLERVRLKARAYGQDVGGDPTQFRIDPEAVVAVYSRWIIPLTKEVEVQYLLARA